MNMVAPQPLLSVVSIPLADIDVGERLRGIDDDAAAVIAASMQEQGQRTPIEVRKVGKRYRLIAGAHRMRALALAGTESYAQAANRGEIVTATKEQQRMCLMAAESVTVARRDGVIVLADNRYWADFLHQHRGTSVVVRFDPQAMHDDLHVYRIDGTYLGAAPCVEKAGFNDKTAAQAAARQFKAFRKLAKDLRAAEVRLDTKQLADVFISEDVPEENLPETKVVRPFRPAPLVAHGNAAVAVDPDFLEDDDEEVSTVIKMRQFMREQR